MRPFVVASTPKEWDKLKLINQLIFRESMIVEFNLIAFFLEDCTSRLIYVFEEEDFDVLCSEWFQLLLNRLMIWEVAIV